MAIYEIQENHIERIQETSFQEVGLRERYDLQRLLRNQMGVVSEDTLVIAEEFGEWEQSRRRIDLLGLDKDANLVVMELKRGTDGGHMELQAIRYAAMVSTLTFEKAVEVYGAYLTKIGSDLHARNSLLGFLEWEEPDEDNFAQDVRILLISADFSRELTTSVMWLNERGLDVRCVRMKPYSDTGRVLVDVQQVIPLPEAADYVVRIREKTGKERIDRADQKDRLHLRHEFWQALLERAKDRTSLHANVSPCTDSWIAAGGGVSGIHYIYVIRKHDSHVELALEGEKEQNKADFDRLTEHRSRIDKDFGEPLEWDRCDDLKKSSIRRTLSLGGYRDDPGGWARIQNAMIDAMIRLEKVLSPYITELRSERPTTEATVSSPRSTEAPQSE